MTEAALSDVDAPPLPLPVRRAHNSRSSSPQQCLEDRQRQLHLDSQPVALTRLDVGRTNDAPSRLALKLTSNTDASLQRLLAKLSVFGCYVEGSPGVMLREADMDGAAPADFYSTTNHRTSIFLGGRWRVVDHQRMDAALVVDGDTVTCRKLRDIRRGDHIVCGMQGVRVLPDLQSRDKPTFGFMSNEVSSERRVETAVARVAEMLRRVKQAGGRIAFVAGPVLVHTGGGEYFCELGGAGADRGAAGADGGGDAAARREFAGQRQRIVEAEAAVEGAGVELGGGVRIERR